MRRVKRTITEARHRLPTPAITKATGTAAPAVAAAEAGAADTAKVSASKASDWAMASALPSTPWRSSPTPLLADGLFAMDRCPSSVSPRPERAPGQARRWPRSP
jgi:hypothetical protein